MPTMLERPGADYQPPAGSGQIVPQRWEEWIWSVYHPDDYIIQWQAHGCSIAAVANRNGNSAPIQVPVRYYCFGFSSQAVVTATGLELTIPYRIGAKNTTGNDWTDGQWMASAVTGDRNALSQVYREWKFPRELGENEIVTFTVDNTVNAGAPAISVDCVIFGYEVRKRSAPVVRT
jgi:hypothetical protein